MGLDDGAIFERSAHLPRVLGEEVPRVAGGIGVLDGVVVCQALRTNHPRGTKPYFICLRINYRKTRIVMLYWGASTSKLMCMN